MINLDKLRKEALERKNYKKKCFTKTLNLCLNKIKIVAKTGATETWFEIPMFSLGQPSFEIKECSKYIMKKLKHNGFSSTYLKPNILLINWDYGFDSD